MSIKRLRPNNDKPIKIQKNKIIFNDDKTIKVPERNIHSRSERAVCLNPSCKGKIRFIDTESRKHYLDKSKVPNNKRLEWYVKYALRKYNDGDRDIAEPTIFVKVRKNKGKVQFEECTNEDQSKLKFAANEIENLTGKGDPDIPTELLAPYGQRYLAPLNYGMKRWMEIFNPRQLLVLVKLIKLIRVAGRILEEEKIKDGFDPIKAFSYVECVVVYLAIALTRYAMFNSLFSSIRASTMMGSIVAECLRYRGIGPVWNWGELHPEADITGSWTRNIKTTRSILKFLFGIYDQNKLENYNGQISPDSRHPYVNILLNDATILKFPDKFDVVITDPPYFDDVPYSELSDFYFVWLKRALSDINENRLSPKFVNNAFFKKISGRNIERQTQWEEFALREVSLDSQRLKKGGSSNEAREHFQELLNASFNTMSESIKSDGLIITYYANTDSDAWKALLKAGWEFSGLSISNVFPVATESNYNIVAKGKMSLSTSIVVVWKGKSEGSISSQKLYEAMTLESERKARVLISVGIDGPDLFIGALTGALAAATRYKEVIEMKRLGINEIVDRYVYPATLYGLANAVSRKVTLEGSIKSSVAMLYLVIKFLYSKSSKKEIPISDCRILALGTNVDLSEIINKMKIFTFEANEDKDEISSLRRRKTVVLLEPVGTDQSKHRQFLELRGLSLETPLIRSSIDALHLLEYYGLVFDTEKFLKHVDSLKIKYSVEVDEALSLARIIVASLPSDNENILCQRMIERTSVVKKDIIDYQGI